MTKADKRESIIMIASEPLTFERSEWMEVKTNTMIVITPKVGHQISDRAVAITGADEPTADPDH